MCGIAGYVGGQAADLVAMAEAMRHRGPDGFGYYQSPEAGLAHRRLSIIDLEGGRQPIVNEDGTLYIIFNGEMYNFREERRLLEQKGHRFRTHTDTEVILHLYEEHGHDAFARINGEFAIALWDSWRREMLLARDRYGIKPLFYTLNGNGLTFASEITALLRSGRVPKVLNPEAVRHYFNYRYNAASQAIFGGVEKLAPGTWLSYRDRDVRTGRYYEISYDRSPKLSIGLDEASEEVRRLLDDAVRRRLFADVEVGLLLSSGIDSSSILALATAHRQRLKTFTMGFGPVLDESYRAQALARHFGADFHGFTITERDLLSLEQVIRCLDEPIGDAIILPMWQLSKHTAQQVKVVLSGEGADEVFGGYIHHLAFFHIQKYLSKVPESLLGLFGELVRHVPLALLNSVFPYPDRLRQADRSKIADFLGHARVYLATRQRMVRLWPNEEFAGPALQPPIPEDDVAPRNFFSGQIDFDLKTWLPSYALYQKDVLSMAHGLEARVPFLDHTLVDFLAKLPFSIFAKGLQVKTILRKAMENDLPRISVQAKKQPFYFPYYRFITKAFIDDVTNMFHTMTRDPLFSGLLSEDAFRDCLKKFSGNVSLVDTKRFMQYIIFLYWYQYKFTNHD